MKSGVIRYDLRSSQHLDEVARAPLPLGLSSRPPERSLYRDIYLDTEEDSLRERGASCRLRIEATDRRTLTLMADGAGATPALRVDSPVDSADFRTALAEDTSAGRRLRALVDPALLSPRIELEIDRITRHAGHDWLLRPRLELHFDEIRARFNGSTRTFHQMCVHRRHADDATWRRLAAALEKQYELAPTSSDARESAEILLAWGRHGSPEAPGPGRRHTVQDPGVDTAERRSLPNFLNPELSLLEFQIRVLAVAEDRATPLAERLRFLSIVGANVDEFHMVRMAGLRRAAREQREEQADDGLTQAEQLSQIMTLVAKIVDRQEACWANCRRELESIGVGVRRWEDLDPSQQDELREACREEIQPSLTPMAMTLSPGHPMPHLPHLTLALAVVLRRESRERPHLAEIELPASDRRFMSVPGTERDCIPVEDVVKANLDMVYPDTRVEGAYVFRVTRGGDLSLDEEEADDLLDAVADAVGKRGRNPAIRLEVERSMPRIVRELLLENLRRELGPAEVELDDADIQESDGLIDLRCLDQLPLPDLPSLHFPKFRGANILHGTESILDETRKRDILAHHPFHSFSKTVTAFVEEAASDPDVTAIKITLYRAGDPSPVVEALLDAAKQGKQVVAFIELKARFDEAHNVSWARKLEKAGVHVIHGLVGLKNHAKVCLVVRREGERLQRYAHVGTGNYNARTGRQYTDLSLFSGRDDLTSDVADLFNVLTGGSHPPQGLSHGSLVSPSQLVESLLQHIDHEAAVAREGRPARIAAKLNGLSDGEIIRALYRASSAGVEIDLVVRGICTLRPGVTGRSERIRVVSVVGRFLEHSRIYRFHNDGSPVHYIGSADLRPRNLRRRVEVLAPVRDADHVAYLDHVLDLYLHDPSGWELGPDGEDHRVGGNAPGAQATLMAEAERMRDSQPA